MDPAYSKIYRDLHERHWWWRAREEIVLATLHRLAPPGGWRAILDIGCGDGLFFEELSRFAPFVEGVESDEGIVSASSRWRDRIHVRRFDETFDTGRRYGLALMLDVLEHLPNPEAALRHALNLLEPDGRIVISVPAFNLLWTSHDEYNHHVTRYTRRSFARLAGAARMRVDSSQYLFHWIWAAKLGQRLKEAVASNAAGPPRVPSAWLNRALLTLCRTEHLLLGRLAVPFGTSLFIVGSAGNQRR
jgi:SAM-dependent methyltransferase